MASFSISSLLSHRDFVKEKTVLPVVRVDQPKMVDRDSFKVSTHFSSNDRQAQKGLNVLKSLASRNKEEVVVLNFRAE